MAYTHKLVYALTIHPELGYRIEAFSVMLNPDESFSLSNTRISPQNLNPSLYEINDTDRMLIKAIDEYSETSIVSKYSKKTKKFSDFINKECDSERLEKIILPFVNRKINNIFSELEEKNIALYFKGKKQDYIRDDEIKLLKDTVEVIFNFSRNALGLKYTLSIREGEKVINLYKKNPAFLSNEPVRLLIDKTIYSFNEDFDRKKLQPFLSNDYILVPKMSRKNFLKLFLLKH